MLKLTTEFSIQEISKREFNVSSINSIQDKYKGIRQDSKPCTFSLQYCGTWVTLHNNSGFPIEEAKEIVANYEKLYRVSKEYSRAKVMQASRDGYITGAFGLRIRTPLLASTILGTKRTPYEAEAEGRTAGNALSQSWCLLNNRAANEFMQRVWNSPYRNLIRPCAHIHHRWI